MNKKTVCAGGVKIGGKSPLALVAGPCVIESRKACLKIAEDLAAFAKRLKVPLVFKASYDKANRSSIRSFRGPGLKEGLDILREVKDRTGLPLLTDVHGPHEVEEAAKVVDVIQIPAFLCRQTDLLIAAGYSGRPVNVKKGQFMAPWDMGNVVDKIESTGNRNIMLTERGACHGYNDLVVDMRGLALMADFGYPVVFDATHSVQKPGGMGNKSGGDPRFIPVLSRAAVAAGCSAVFIETHPDPQKALSDGANSLPLKDLPALWKVLKRISSAIK